MVRRSAGVLPTLFTLGNVLSGFMAIFLASRPADTKLPLDWSPLTFAALCVFLGMVFDALDGRIARLTRNTSDLGEQLDSMADMVTFGVAPAFIAVQLILAAQTPFFSAEAMSSSFFASGRADTYFGRITLSVAAVYVACTALRLARFNVETKSDKIEDHMHFKGLPSPGAGGTVAAMILLHQHYLANYTRQAALHAGDASTAMSWTLLLTAIGMVCLMLLVAFAMVSRLKYVHAANAYLRRREPIGTTAKLVVVISLLVVFPQQAIAAGFVFYALSAPVLWLWRVMFKRQQTPVAT